MTHIARSIKIWFALKVIDFRCGEQCAWDNNNGINYEVIPEKLTQICLPKEPEVPKSLPPPHVPVINSLQSAKPQLSKPVPLPTTPFKSHIQPSPLPLSLSAPVFKPQPSQRTQIIKPSPQPQIIQSQPFYPTINKPCLAPQFAPLPLKHPQQQQMKPLPQFQSQSQSKPSPSQPRPITQFKPQVQQPTLQVVQKVSPPKQPTTFIYTQQKERIPFSPSNEFTSRLYLPPNYLPDHSITSMLKGHRRMYDEYIC